MRLFKSEILLETKALGQPAPSDEVCLQVLRKQIKLRQDTLQVYRDAGVASDSHKEDSEIELLESFLPQQLTADELEAVVMEQVGKSGLELQVRNMAPLINLVVDKVGRGASKADIAKALKQKIK